MLGVGSGAGEGKVRGGAYYVGQVLLLAQGLEQDLVLLKMANLASRNYDKSELSPSHFAPFCSLKGAGLRPPPYPRAPIQRPRPAPPH